MQKTLKLNTYQDYPINFIVDRVEDILCVITYFVSGDECAIVVYTDGDYLLLDSGAAADDDRMVDFGPEDIMVQLPSDIQWEDQVNVA